MRDPVKFTLDANLRDGTSAEKLGRKLREKYKPTSETSSV